MARSRYDSASVGGLYTRREALRTLSTGAVSLSLPAALGRPTAHAGGKRVGHQTEIPRAKACILLWMTGGPPQHETWDPKPDAPAEIRGPFGTIATSIPGVRVGELMPNTARILDRLAVLRAVHTDNPSHPGSSYEMMTGTVHA